MNHEYAHQHLSESDPRMAELIARSRRYDIAASASVRPLDALAESIAYQQLSGKAAAKPAPEIRRKMAAVPLSGRMVFLARIGWAGKKSRGLKVCDVTLGLPSKLS